MNLERPADSLHAWWGLSYANYLTIPRSIMQSMPAEWQEQMSELLRELDQAASDNGVQWPPEGCSIRVQLTEKPEGKRLRVVEDELSRYDRGRRRLWG